MDGAKAEFCWLFIYSQAAPYVGKSGGLLLDETEGQKSPSENPSHIYHLSVKPRWDTQHASLDETVVGQVHLVVARNVIPRT